MITAFDDDQPIIFHCKMAPETNFR